MKVTKIRDSKNQIPSNDVLELIQSALERKLSGAGFTTGVHIQGPTSMKIGLHMSSFRINTAKLGHNARLGNSAYGYNGCKSPKGYKRTDVPTWDQRVEFNDIVNSVFDRYKCSANIKSGIYQIRKGMHSYQEFDWSNTSSDHFTYSGDALRDIIPEKEARESLGSDLLEAQHKEKMREHNRQVSKERRALMSVFVRAPKVTLDGFYQDQKKNGKQIPHYLFYKVLAKLSRWEARRVKEASIKATIAKAREPKLSLVGAK